MLPLIITLAVSGTLLIALEMFLPGGILGVIAAALFLGVVVLCYQEYGAQAGTPALVGFSLGGLALFMTWLKIFPSSPAGKLLTLRGNVSGHSVPESAGVPPGSECVAVTALRPSGTVRVGDARHEARMDSGYADPGAMLRVVRVDGPTLVVAPAPPPDEASGKVS